MHARDLTLFPRGVRDLLILAAMKAVRRKPSAAQSHGGLHFDHQRQP
jgi:hypothetical protein